MARKAKVVGIEFRPATGGMMSEMHKETPRSGQGGGPLTEHESEMTIHPSMEHAKAHLEKCMGHCFGAGDGKKTADEGGE